MPRGASLTAQIVCLCRAWEQLRPQGQRVVDDPLAKHFVGPQLGLAMTKLVAKALAGTGRLGPTPGGLANFVVARHRFMDDALEAALARGVSQVVILGAGYDTRGYRFGTRLRGRPVFEVDFPATQARKVRLLRRAGTLPFSDVRHVGLDFEKDSLGERLAQTDDFEVGAPTFFIWEGVSMYLSQAAVQDTLRVIAEVAAPGSEVVADFWDSAVPGTPWRRTLQMGKLLLAQIGEPIDFSVSPMDVAGFLSSQGFEAADVAESKVLRQRYVMGNRQLLPGGYLVRARVVA